MLVKVVAVGTEADSVYSWDRMTADDWDLVPHPVRALAFRHRTQYWYAAGTIDVRLDDEDYFDPWRATRFVAIWLSSLLDETDGNLDLAVRAYHRGVRRALDPKGDEYSRAVSRRLDVYVRGGGSSPSWRHLLRRDREITRVAWPWLRARRVLGPDQRPATMALDRPDDATPTWWGFALSPAPRLP